MSAYRQQPAGRVTRYLVSKAAQASLSRVQRPTARLSLRDVGAFAQLRTSVDDIVGDLCGHPAATAEETEVLGEIESRIESLGLATPGFRTGEASLAVLYRLIRATRPSTVLETGVADGVSSAVILRALESNGTGTLHSVDIDPGVGRVALAGDTSRWRLHVHEHIGGERQMRALVANLGTIDVYYHDSGHSWLWQTFEYETVAPHVAGLFLSDDIDASHAFADHCRKMAVRPSALVESGKVFGGYSVGERTA